MRNTTGIAFSIFILWSCNQKQPEQKRTQSVEFSVEDKKVLIYTTADSTDLRLTLTDTLAFEKHGQPLETETCVFVDPTKSFQTFLGIGGAITDASAETFAKLSENKQQEFLKAYYDKDSGIGYTLARTHINSCDFSSGSYAYVQDGDVDLKTFSITHDRQFRIPLIQKAIAAAGGKLTLYASPWSPPAWMKDNNDMLHGGKLKSDYYQSWANYYSKFIRAYESEGIAIWGLTVQNEPMAKQKWESCIYTAEEERDFVKNFLGPTLKREGLGDRKLIVWDHNRDLIYHRAQTIFSDADASQYIWGMGFHWYEDWSGGGQVFDNVKKINESWPEKNLIFTEGCNFPFALDRVADWKWGERYGLSMINDFNSGTVAWTDWNILLDETGGPNHAKNFCMAPIHADTRTGELIFTNSYYYIGHFSKFLAKDAKRIVSSSSRTSLQTTAFTNPGGEQIVIVMNSTNKAISYQLIVQSSAVAITAASHSISTLVIK